MDFTRKWEDCGSCLTCEELVGVTWRVSDCEKLVGDCLQEMMGLVLGGGIVLF